MTDLEVATVVAAARALFERTRGAEPAPANKAPATAPAGASA